MAGLENAEGQVQELAHDSDDQGSTRYSALLKALGEGSQAGIKAFGKHSGPVQGGPNGGAALFGNDGFAMNGNA